MYQLRTHFYRIATTEAGLTTGSFYKLQLPEPQTPFFQPYSVRVPQGLGGQGRHGYSQAFLQWDHLIREHANTLQALVTAAEVIGGVGNGTLFITMPRADASSAGQAWVDISGIAEMPEWRTENWSQAMKYQPITLVLNNVTVVNEPSTVL